MWQIVLNTVGRYVPYITLPIAALIGIVGYHTEKILSSRYTPYRDSVKEERETRQLESLIKSEPESLKEKKFVPKTIFEQNVPPSLQSK